MLFYLLPKEIKRKDQIKKKNGRSYWKLSVKYVQYSVTVPREFPSTLIKQRITDTEEDKNEWKQIIYIMETDDKFKIYYQLRESYINAIYIGRVERIKKRRSLYNPLDENLRDATKQSIYYRYIETNVYMNADTFKEAIENKNYIENECWINTLMDYYGETILSPDRALRYRITREKLLDILNVNEETIKEGLSVLQVVPFFEKFKLCLNLFILVFYILRKDPCFSLKVLLVGQAFS